VNPDRRSSVLGTAVQFETVIKKTGSQKTIRLMVQKSQGQPPEDAGYPGNYTPSNGESRTSEPSTVTVCGKSPRLGNIRPTGNPLQWIHLMIETSC